MAIKGLLNWLFTIRFLEMSDVEQISICGDFGASVTTVTPATPEGDFLRNCTKNLQKCSESFHHSFNSVPTKFGRFSNVTSAHFMACPSS
jgi:hypothetical protein